MSQPPVGQSVEMVVKMDEVLELLRDRGALTVGEIAKGVDEPRSSIYRLMRALEEMGFVEPSPHSSSYQLGLRLFALGNRVASELEIIDAAAPALDSLFQSTGQTVFLMMRDGHEAVCLARREGAQVQSMAVATGGTLPLHLGAGPIVLLAHADPAFVEEYLSSGALSAWTERSVHSPEAIRERLTETRARGYAISDEDLVPGIAAVGAPIRTEAGEVRAALSMSGTRSALLGEATESTVAAIRAAADSVTAPDE
jgi:DNA-binding IclR family transcriptional regulator